MQNTVVSHSTFLKATPFTKSIITGLFITLFSFSAFGGFFSKDKAAPNPKVLQLAAKAYQNAANSGVAKKSLVTIIDYSLPSSQRRLWVMDMKQNKVIYHTLVAHGQGSGDNHAKRFSDRHGSHQSSLGLFKTGKTYSGKHGLSLELHGLEKGVNSNALSRRVVIHAANYVTEGSIKALGRLGRSWGCPALSPHEAKPIINTIKDGSLVFIYYPDNNWLKTSRYLA
jgi:hypothetical protein